MDFFFKKEVEKFLAIRNMSKVRYNNCLLYVRSNYILLMY